MNAQGQKTGGRQKGTPNKINASVKYMFKALMMNNYDLVEDSFQKAKPNERLTFIAKMTPFLCAKEQPSKNGGEWVMDQSMDHEWFQMYESDHLLRRKQRIEHEENYAIQDINSQYSYEWQMIHDACAQFNRLGMDGEDVKKMIFKRVDEFFNEQRNDKDRVRENFQQRRDNFMKIEQEFFNEQDAAEEGTEEVAKEVAAEEEETVKVEEANQQSEKDSHNTKIPISQYPEEASVNPSPANAASNTIRLNSSTLDTANPSFILGGDSVAAHSAGKNQHQNSSTLDTPAPSFSIENTSDTAQSAPEPIRLNPSTLDTANHEKKEAEPPYPAQSEKQKTSPQKPNIRHLRQQQHRPFYTAIANKRRR